MDFKRIQRSHEFPDLTEHKKSSNCVFGNPPFT